MPEEAAIKHSDTPRTVASLSADLRTLGLRKGMTVLVHSSMSSLGWVAGGGQAVLLAMTQTLGVEGTLVMPAYTTDNSDPRDWRAPPIPEAWWQTVRDNMPAFDPRRTPTRGMGHIAEVFRSWPDVRRSEHPATSFCAWGRHADMITRNHGLANGFADSSPLARIYELRGHVLLLGVGHDANSSLHLAEHRCEWPRKRVLDQGAAMLVNGRREWVRFNDVILDSSDFGLIGAAFDATGVTLGGKVGSAACKLMSQVSLVDFGVKWIRENRR
ncbi:MAG: AAC(3) family N-acetyltransferase [Dechloromonas sp.]|nr:MAG: AAC(3) family N-acetyltransferase [Dechloromonas sp.]